MDLDPVRPGLARPPRPGREAADDLRDVGLRHPLAAQAVDGLGLVGRAPPLLVDDPADVALAARESELDEVPAVVLVHLPDERAPEGDRLVAVDVRVVRDDQAARVHRSVRRDDRTDAAARELEIPVDVRLVAGAVVVVEPPGKARAKDAVLQLEVPEAERLEDDRRVGCAHTTAGSRSRAGTS